MSGQETLISFSVFTPSWNDAEQIQPGHQQTIRSYPGEED